MIEFFVGGTIFGSLIAFVATSYRCKKKINGLKKEMEMEEQKWMLTGEG